VRFYFVGSCYSYSMGLADSVIVSTLLPFIYPSVGALIVVLGFIFCAYALGNVWYVRWRDEMFRRIAETNGLRTTFDYQEADFIKPHLIMFGEVVPVRTLRGTAHDEEFTIQDKVRWVQSIIPLPRKWFVMTRLHFFEHTSAWITTLNYKGNEVRISSDKTASTNTLASEAEIIECLRRLRDVAPQGTSVQQSYEDTDDRSYWQRHPSVPLAIVAVGSFVSISSISLAYWFWQMITQSPLLLMFTWSLFMISSLSVLVVIAYLGVNPYLGGKTHSVVNVNSVFGALLISFLFIAALFQVTSMWAKSTQVVGTLEHGVDIQTLDAGCYWKAMPSQHAICTGTANDRLLELLIGRR